MPNFLGLLKQNPKLLDTKCEAKQAPQRALKIEVTLNTQIERGGGNEREGIREEKEKEKKHLMTYL